MKRNAALLVTLLALLCLLPVGASALADGEYCVSLDMSGGSGKASISTPAPLSVENGVAYVELTWSSNSYDYMLVDGVRYEPISQPGRNSCFRIPVPAFDELVDVVADTTGMGKPVEIHYRLYFYSDSIADRSQLPQEAAKRVLMMAAVMIVGGGILNAYLKKRHEA